MAIRIREAVPEDAEALLKIYAPYVTDTAITFEYEVPSAEEFKSRIKKTCERYPYLVAEDGETAVGYAYAGPFKGRAAYDWSVEMTVYVDRNRKRQGIGRLLYRTLEACLRRQGILNANACIGFPEQEDRYLTADSVKFHEKEGYRMVGMFHNCGYKFNRWYHMVWMEKMLGKHTVPQPEVISFPEAGFPPEVRTGNPEN